MTLRLSPIIFACGLVAFAGAANAQYQPPGPDRGPGGYRYPAPEPVDPPVTYSLPDVDDEDPPPFYEQRQPAAPRARYEQPPPAPQRGLSAIPIFGPLLSPGTAPATGQVAPNQNPNMRSGDGPQQGNAQPGMRPPADIGYSQGGAPLQGTTLASLPPEDQPEADTKELPAHLKRQFVDYVTREPVGTIVIDTPNTYLYLVLTNGKAMRYGIGVGREGFTWTGAERISRMAEWPDWHPPAEMIERQPYLPRFMAGGDGNPLGARALYLGKTLYRIHGTNQPSTIGTFVSSGCIRLVNEDVADLYSRVTVGTRVVVLPGRPAVPTAQNTPLPQTIR